MKQPSRRHPLDQLYPASLRIEPAGDRWRLVGETVAGDPVEFGEFDQRDKAQYAIHLLSIPLSIPPVRDEARPAAPPPAPDALFYVYAKATPRDLDYANDPQVDRYPSLWAAERRARHLATSYGYGEGSAWVCDSRHDMVLAFIERNGQLCEEPPTGAFAEQLAKERLRFVEAMFISDTTGEAPREWPCYVDLETGEVQVDSDDENIFGEREFVLDAVGAGHAVFITERCTLELEEPEAFRLACQLAASATASPSP